MRHIDWSDAGEPVLEFDSIGVSSAALAHATGETHVYILRFNPGGRIGTHRAGFDQLFFVLSGQGWVVGSEGARRELGAGEGTHIALGEVHTKGSDGGMTALMIQIAGLTER